MSPPIHPLMLTLTLTPTPTPTLALALALPLTLSEVSPSFSTMTSVDAAPGRSWVGDRGRVRVRVGVRVRVRVGVRDRLRVRDAADRHEGQTRRKGSEDPLEDPPFRLSRVGYG